jgi:3-oxoacyl-[acyl-carrier protein] reductase
MDKVAIVLGTSSGIGQAIAWSLLGRGFLVFGGSRRESSIDHERFIDIEIDLTQTHQVQSFIREVTGDTEVVDLLVNAAGMCEMNSVEDTTMLEMRSHFETNVMGQFNFLKEFERLIIHEETHIINLFSISAKSIFPNTLSYTTSEFAKNSMLKVFEKEWKKYEIRFTNFYIGAVNTPLWEDYPELEVDKMLSIEDFVYMFEAILSAPAHIQFPELTFLHKDGFLE